MTDPRRANEQARRMVAERYRDAWFWTQWAGVALVFGAMIAAIFNVTRFGRHGTPLEIGAIVALILGLALVGVAFWRRNAYHRRRNSGN